MHQWASLKQGETRPRTFILPPKMRAAGMTITDCVVTVSVFRPTVGGDPSPMGCINGSRVINSASEVIDGITVDIGQAVTQKLTGQVAGNVYAVNFRMTLSDGTIYNEDMIQPCTTYVPP